MFKWLKRKGLVFSSSLILSLLLMTIVSVLNGISYSNQKQAVYREFEQIGNKLRDQAQANVAVIETAASAVEAGQTLPEYEMGVLKKLLDAMTDTDLLTNSYYFNTASSTDQEGKTYFQLLQGSESLIAMNLLPGSPYEASEIFVDAFEKSKQGRSGLTPSYSDRHGDWIAYMAPIKSEAGEVIAIFGLDFDYDKVESRINGLLLKSSAISGAISIISILLVIWLVRLAVAPLRALAASSKEAAKGDLTVTVPVTTGNEIGQAGTAFNEMIASLRELTIHIDRTSMEVADSSQNLKETATQTEAATNEIAEAIQSVAVSSETQLASSQECQRAMTEMTIGIQRIAESSSVVSELAAGTANLAAAGEEVISRTVRQMNTIEGHVFSAADAMSQLNESSNRIGDILSHISDVANQTNLLALNASIEAARAGEHGKGFAVVAHEIRKLAERSKESSNEISAILHEIGTRSQEVASSLSISANEARTGTELASESGDSFRSILRSVKEVSDQVQEVSAASEQMSAGSEEIAASLVELERMAHTSASHSQEVAAASEEQLASVEEVAGASEQLRTLANELREAVGRFKV